MNFKIIIINSAKVKFIINIIGNFKLYIINFIKIQYLMRKYSYFMLKKVVMCDKILNYIMIDLIN